MSMNTEEIPTPTNKELFDSFEWVRSCALTGDRHAEVALVKWSQLEHELAEAKARIAELEKDKARLDWLTDQAQKSHTGISFDWCKHVEEGQVLEHGFRFMRRHFLGERKSTLRQAIDAAMAAQH